MWPKDEACYRGNERNDLIDSLAYALLFPDGTPGWHENLQRDGDRQTKKYTRVTASQFYANRLMVRDTEILCLRQLDTSSSSTLLMFTVAQKAIRAHQSALRASVIMALLLLSLLLLSL